MRIRNQAVVACASLYTLSALIPLLHSDQWWIRVWDFPRLQLFVFGIGSMVLIFLASTFGGRKKFAWASVVAAGLAVDLYRILPYTSFVPLEVQWASAERRERSIKVFVANVLQGNDDSARLMALIDSASPDVVLLLEVNDSWMKALEPLKNSFPHQVVEALDNKYGMALLSRFELDDTSVQFLVEPRVPSVVATARLDSGDEVVIFGVHPKPPNPKEGDSTERDAELVLVGKMASTHKSPVIVMGDFNDVAWSHTSRLFRRVSRLLDPRVGRGPFATFPAEWPLLRFPLDYVFHSDHFTLVRMELQPKFGSDHLALSAELQLEEGARERQEAPPAEDEDLEESERALKRGSSD